MDLYTYYRSTSSYRVRIALALKGLEARHIPVNLAYRAINPQARVPALRTDEGQLLIQSPAIIEYLEERYPQPALLPADPLERARQRGVAALIGCDIHPLHNVAVLGRLRALGLSEEQVQQWIAHWIGEGLRAVEALIGDEGFCFGEPGLADVYLLPQLYAAHRFNVDLSGQTRIARVERLALEHPAFIKAHPDAQADKPA
jgi:maleylacetoacetate isomerase